LFARGVRDRFSWRQQKQQQQLSGCFVAEMAATVYNLFVINKSGGLIFYKVIKKNQIKNSPSVSHLLFCFSSIFFVVCCRSLSDENSIAAAAASFDASGFVRSARGKYKSY
jgi:hypothetical protein